MKVPTEEQVLALLRTGSPDERVAFLKRLPPSDLGDAASGLIGSSNPGIVIIALASATMQYCYGSQPELGAVMAAALHERAVEIWHTVPNHGLIPTTLSSLACAHAKALAVLGRSSEVLEVTAQSIPIYEKLGEEENLPVLKVLRIEALLNLQQIDEAEVALRDSALLRHPIAGREARPLKDWGDRYLPESISQPRPERGSSTLTPSSAELLDVLKTAMGSPDYPDMAAALRRMAALDPAYPDLNALRHEVRGTIGRGIGAEDSSEASPAASSADDDALDDTLGLDLDMPEVESAGTQPPRPETRWLNAELRDHDQREPLKVGTAYVLEFGVDLRPRGDASTQVPSPPLLFKPGEDLIELTILLESRDFQIAKSEQQLQLPRSGASLNKPRFDVTPLRTGRGTLTAFVCKDGNFLLRMDVAYSIGTVAPEPPSTESFGRPIAAVASLRPRQLSIVIEPAPAGGYQCTFIADQGAKKVFLPITEAGLGDAIKTARADLMSVITQRDSSSRLVFQIGVEVDEASAAKALNTLARTGARLFQKIFPRTATGTEIEQMAELLRTRAMNPNDRLTLQIVSKQFAIPWGLLYFGAVDQNATLSWDNFLGMRCIIEQLPLVDSFVADSVIASDRPSLAVSINLNRGIDEQMKTDVVARQLEFWEDSTATLGSSLLFAQRESRADFLTALRGDANDQLMYLYCHAVTAGPGDAGGISSSCLILTGGERVTLDDLNLDAPTDRPLPGNPLVFINACESAELTPAFYDGFVPYFIAKSARGVIGTECKTPAVFATEWALRFFPRFLGGEPLGELMLGLRQEFCNRHNNPLGLLYAVYCDADTQIQPGLKLH